MLKEKLEQTDSSVTILDYLEQNFSSFHQAPLNEVDGLIFSQLSYLDLEKEVPSLTADEEWVPISTLYKAEEFGYLIEKTLTPSQNLILIQEICCSPRFRDVQMNYYVNKWDKEAEEQFSAVTFRLPTGEILISFRGTDLTVTGWKEDFNMFFTSPVPSQLSAKHYLNEVAEKTNGDIFVMGHSKGGNLSVYSASFCEEIVQPRIQRVYNFDGPGFPKDILEDHHYIDEQEKIVKIVPQGSIIGLMFDSIHPPKIIKSHNIGPLQHDPFSWLCEETSFVESGKFSNHILHLDRSLDQWLSELDVEQRKTFVETMFAVISAMNVESLDEISLFDLKEAETLLKAMKGVDPETAQCVKMMLKKFVEITLSTGMADVKAELADIKPTKILTKFFPQ